MPIYGVLIAPARREVWSAVRGKGAKLNGKTIIASNRKLIKGARIPADQLLKNDDLLALVYKPNSIALRMAMVAANEADLLVSARWGNEWDISAAHLIAQEAGAFVGNAYGNIISYNKAEAMDFGMICCAPGLREALLKRIKPFIDKIEKK